MTKKSFLLSAAGLLTAGLLTACIPGTDTTAPGTPAANSPEPSSTMQSTAEPAGNTQAPAETLGSFTTTDIYENPVTEAIFANHDLTMVNIFATWCGPCIQEMPDLAELAKEYEGSNFQIIGLILDVNENGIVSAKKLETAKELAELTGVEYPIILPDMTLRHGLLANVYSIPETFFVDGTGTIVSERYVGSRQKNAWQKIIKKELSELEN